MHQRTVRITQHGKAHFLYANTLTACVYPTVKIHVFAFSGVCFLGLSDIMRAQVIIILDSSSVPKQQSSSLKLPAE